MSVSIADQPELPSPAQRRLDYGCIARAGELPCAQSGMDELYFPDEEMSQSDRKEREMLARVVCFACPVLEGCGLVAIESSVKTNAIRAGLSQNQLSRIRKLPDPTQREAALRGAWSRERKGIDTRSLTLMRTIAIRAALEAAADTPQKPNTAIVDVLTDAKLMKVA